MQFDGEERYRSVRKERHLGALRREGFQPARRHPSASRRRSTTAVGGFADRVYSGHHNDCLPEDSRRNVAVSVGTNAIHHVQLCGTFNKSASALPLVSPSQNYGSDLKADGHAMQNRNGYPERSWSAPPTRMTTAATLTLSTDMKAQRASSAARKLCQMESTDAFQRPEVEKLYVWLKTISLQEYLPALLQVIFPGSPLNFPVCHRCLISSAHVLSRWPHF
jgi:hypothetical protein